MEPRNRLFSGSRRRQARRKATAVDVDRRDPTPLRGRRPQTCLETLCARTGRPQQRPLCNEAAGRRENAMSDESFVYAAGESHDGIVPAKAPNKDLSRSAEGLEGRRSIKENTRELNPS